MGTRNERNPSLWVGTTPKGEFTPLPGNTETDVVVIGAGITGLTAARLAVDEGRRVVVIDAGDICAGVTGYTTAKLTSLHSTIYSEIEESFGVEASQAYAAANEAAIAKVVQLSQIDEIDCELQPAAAYTYTEDPSKVDDIEAEVGAAQRAGLQAVFTSESDLPYEIAGAVRLDGQYQFHPRQYCLGLCEAIAGRGGSVHSRTRALEVDPDSREVTTDRGTIRADAVVIATHQPFPKHGAYFARVEPWRSYAIAGRRDELPAGMYISIDEPTRSVRATASGYLIVGGQSHKVGHDPNTEQHYESLRGWAQERFGIDAEFQWSAQDYKSADGLPYIGRMTPGSERVFVATGFRKWGMTNGTVAGMIVNDAIAGRDNPWSSTFDSTRLALRQSARGLVRENVDVAKRFVGDRVAQVRPPQAGELAPGEGGIVDLDGETVAGYRDDDGVLHALSPNCTHMGCRVAFNSAERSWDCPCHGSRFDSTGRVIEGPAVEDLSPAKATEPA